MALKKDQHVDCFFKLGDQASMFFDPSAKNKFQVNPKKPFSGLKVVGTEPAHFRGNVTARMEIALRNSHIIQMSAKEVELDAEEKAEEKADDEEVVLTDLTKKQLVEYFKENFEYTEEQLDELSSMNKSDMVSHIESLL